MLFAGAIVGLWKGSIDGPRRSFTIYDNDQMTKAAEYESVIVAYRNSGPVRRDALRTGWPWQAQPAGDGRHVSGNGEEAGDRHRRE